MILWSFQKKPHRLDKQTTDLLFRRRKQKSCDTKLLEKSPSHLFPKLLQDTGCHQIEITMVLAAIKGVGLPCGQIKVQIYIYLMLQTKTK